MDSISSPFWILRLLPICTIKNKAAVKSFVPKLFSILEDHVLGINSPGSFWRCLVHFLQLFPNKAQLLFEKRILRLSLSGLVLHIHLAPAEKHDPFSFPTKDKPSLAGRSKPDQRLCSPVHFVPFVFCSFCGLWVWILPRSDPLGEKNSSAAGIRNRCFQAGRMEPGQTPRPQHPEWWVRENNSPARLRVGLSSHTLRSLQD